MDTEKQKLLKNTICKDISDNEFQIFLHACVRTGLDPFMRQIWPVCRYDNVSRKMVMSIQTGIDGYRLLADRTGKYTPGREPTFVYTDNKIVSSTAYIKKMTPDGTWHEVSATAYYDEYVGLKKDRTPTLMWATKGHIMLSKCAEALALRKAFPADLSGIYTSDEMEQASNPVVFEKEEPKEEPKEESKPKKITASNIQISEINDLMKVCGEEYRSMIEKNLSKNFGIESFDDLTVELYDRVRNACLKFIKNEEEKKGDENV